MIITSWHTKESCEYISVSKHTWDRIVQTIDEIKHYTRDLEYERPNEIIAQLLSIVKDKRILSKDEFISEGQLSRRLYLDFMENLRRSLEDDANNQASRNLVNYLIRTQISLSNSPLKACEKCCTIKFIVDMEDKHNSLGEFYYECLDSDSKRCKERENEIIRKSWSHLSMLAEPFNYRLRRYIRASTGLRYVEQIEDCTDDFILSIPGIGKKGLSDIRTSIVNYRSITV